MQADKQNTLLKIYSNSNGSFNVIEVWWNSYQYEMILYTPYLVLNNIFSIWKTSIFLNQIRQAYAVAPYRNILSFFYDAVAANPPTTFYTLYLKKNKTCHSGLRTTL